MAEHVIRNEYDEVVLMSSLPQMAQPMAFGGGQTPTQIANRFIHENIDQLALSQSRLEDDPTALSDYSRANDPVIKVSLEKGLGNSRVVVYDQLVMDLPIFDARLGVHIDTKNMAVTSVQSSMHRIVTVTNPGAKSDNIAQKYTSEALEQVLGIHLDNLKDGRIERQVVYRYEPDQRIEKLEDDDEGCFSGSTSYVLDLPDVPNDIQKGNHYIVNEILFSASVRPEEPAVNWRALVEPISGAVLYIRALVASAVGMVYVRDPQTQTGANVTGASSSAVLNPFRSSVSLSGITPSSPQTLAGEYVVVEDTSLPAIAPPTVPNPTGAFNFDVRTDDFSAVNAYYHCDALFRTMADYGIDVLSYFDGTAFPVRVDHRGKGGQVNADAPGNSSGNGLAQLRFGLLQAGQPVGIATSNRVVWHEFGHALLWDHVNSPNFGFAHSAGDSLATILNDPFTNELDRFDSFPWVQEATPLGRRHDRTIADGWAWFGPQYNTQYRGEQILSSTFFRLYRSLGGDSSYQPARIRAAQTVAYLIFKGIGLLTSTTPYPEVFVENLQNADLTTTDFKGIPGGALHKVIRWAFEKQGLFQPGAQPGQGNNVMTEGNPPDVDVYIDDGRNGQYEYLANHWSCHDMWVRRSADGGLVHEQPVVGMTNYMYVRVKNRGMQAANNVRVDVYHCMPGTGLAFPDDWVPMDTPSLPASGPLVPGGGVIVGPFAFVPTQVGHECLLAIAHADDDPGNDTKITGTIPEYRFVPFDNNIAQRNVHPVAPSWRYLASFFRKHLIWVRNPLRIPVVCRIEIELPRFLRQLGWEISVTSAGGHKFEMAPRDRREVILSIRPGKEYLPEVAKRAIAEGDHEIKIFTYLGDEPSGGMTYQLTFDVREGAVEDEQDKGIREEKSQPTLEARRPFTIEEILNVLGGSPPVAGGSVFDRRVRTVRLELDLSDDNE